MVDKVLFRKAQTKIALAESPEEHYRLERHGEVEQVVQGRRYRLTWTIKRLKAEVEKANR